MFGMVFEQQLPEAVAKACSFAWKMDRRHLLLSVVLFLVQRSSVQY